MTSLAHWGGVVEAWETTLDAQESKIPSELAGSIQKLQCLDRTRLPEELPGLLESFSWREINFLNSPLLDALFHLLTGYHPKEGDHPRVYHLDTYVYDEPIQNWSWLIQKSARCGLELFQYLVGKEPGYQITESGYALPFAAEAGQEVVVRYLVENGVQPDVYHGLALVRTVNYPAIIRYLHEKGVPLEIRVGEVLLQATVSQALETLQYLLEHGSFSMELKRMAFVKACREGFLAGVKLLYIPFSDFLEGGLEAAIYAGHLEIILHLMAIKDTATPYPRSWNAGNPAYWNAAFRGGRMEVVRELVALQFPFTEPKETYLREVSREASAEIVEFIWNRPSVLNSQDSTAQKLLALAEAAAGKNASVVQLLLAKGLREGPTARGHAVARACFGRSFDCAKLLLEAGFHSGDSLITAIQTEDEKLVNLLLEYPQEQTVLDTALWDAFKFSSLAVAKKILALGARGDFTKILNHTLSGQSYPHRLNVGLLENIQFLIANGGNPAQVKAIQASFYFLESDSRVRAEVMRLLLQGGFDAGEYLTALFVTAVRRRDLTTFRLIKGKPSREVLLTVIQEPETGFWTSEEEDEKAGKEVTAGKEETKSTRLLFLQDIFARRPFKEWSEEEQAQVFNSIRDRQTEAYLTQLGFAAKRS